MLAEIFATGLSLAAAGLHAAASLHVPNTSALVTAAASAGSGKAEAPVFRPHERAVSNWRHESLFALNLSPLDTLRIASGKDSASLPRCIRLSNYWCIKKAGWTGEIASDAEGHVAFSSALEGATVAAVLLRHYYVDLNRHSALSIISRWAPAQCGGTSLSAGPRGKGASLMTSSASLRELAPRGLQNTLRARWLAAHGRGGVGRPPRFAAQAPRSAAPPSPRHSIVRERMPAMMRAPEIAVGMGERDVKLKPITFSALNITTTMAPAISCSGDLPRIEAYARHAIAGAAEDIHDDLRLFDETGAPSPNLARVMDNMAAVEIGPYGVRHWLIDAAIATAVLRAAPAKAAAQVPPARP